MYYYYYFDSRWSEFASVDHAKVDTRTLKNCSNLTDMFFLDTVLKDTILNFFI